LRRAPSAIINSNASASGSSQEIRKSGKGIQDFTFIASRSVAGDRWALTERPYTMMMMMMMKTQSFRTSACPCYGPGQDDQSICCLSKCDKPIVIHVSSGQGAESSVTPIDIGQFAAIDAFCFQQRSTVRPFLTRRKGMSEQTPNDCMRIRFKAEALVGGATIIERVIVAQRVVEKSAIDHPTVERIAFRDRLGRRGERMQTSLIANVLFCLSPTSLRTPTARGIDTDDRRTDFATPTRGRFSG
jgi:hypothetical protein